MTENTITTHNMTTTDTSNTIIDTDMISKNNTMKNEATANMRKVNFTLTDQCAILLKVMITKSGTLGYALVDTGALMTIFDESIYDDLLKNEKDVRNAILYATGITGTTEGESKSLTVLATLDGDNGEPVYLKVKGVTCDMTRVKDYFQKELGQDYNIVMILGADSMVPLNTTIDYVNRYMTMGETAKVNREGSSGEVAQDKVSEDSLKYSMTA